MPINNGSITIIGDVHGKKERYASIVRNYHGSTIQVGDFGFHDDHAWHLKHIDSRKHMICFGNHDDYAYLGKAHSTGDFRYFPEWRLMTIRGAASTDKHFRQNGKWWECEELTDDEFAACLKLFKRVKPLVVVSHDAPWSVAEKVYNRKYPSRTNLGLQACLDSWAPKLWVHGHHHVHVDRIIRGTRFVCLRELETFPLKPEHLQ